MIEFSRLVKNFAGKNVLTGVDLCIPPGTLQFIVGTSGAGKSVLMKHVVGLVRADTGKVIFDGEDITFLSEPEFYRIRRRCGFVFQHSTLLDGMNVLDNVALPIEKRNRVSLKKARVRAAEELERLHLLAYAQAFPSELGAGLKKRAAIARALALDPEYIIYDEPTTNLDPVAARRVDALFLELRARGVTQIVVSHDLASIFGVADRIAMIHAGCVRAEGCPAEIRGSADPVLAQFFSGSCEGPI